MLFVPYTDKRQCPYFHLNFQQVEHGILTCTNPLNEVLQMTLEIIRQDLEEGADSELTRLQGIYSR